MNDPGGQTRGPEDVGSGKPRPRSLIVGCGYVGESIARRLHASGHQVFGLRRSEPESLPVGLPYIPLQANLTEPGSLQTLAALDVPFDCVVLCASASGGDAEAYRQVYFEGTGHLLARLRGQAPRAFVYTGSTSVYSQTDGSWVDELSPTEPESESGLWLLRAEQRILDAHREWGLAGRILRVAGIYGPGRGSLLRRVLSGQAGLEGSGDRWTNRIHREDLADAVIAVLQRGRSGEIYNVADQEPATQRCVLEWLSERTGIPLREGAEESPKSGRRRRGGSNKRVRIDKVRRETGWSPTRPSFREGYLEELGHIRVEGSTGSTRVQSPPFSRGGS
ncbi:MAG: SDR family oxidoreductase [Verrucomicrobia bacterium]|nr:SDR family oxidoreductase [Verrucomicrobiota bacterium]